MHYYDFNVGDYRRSTGHLTMLEHGAYRQLLDTYYLNEKPLPADLPELMRMHCARSPDEQSALQTVLKEFFTLTDAGWCHAYCEKVINLYRGKTRGAKKAAKARWDKEKLAHANAMRTHSERNANGMPTNNHKPITNNQEPDVNSGSRRKQKPALLDLTCWPSRPSSQVFDDWLAMRKRIKADVSQTVVDQFGKQFHLAAAEGYTVDDCLSECIASNWRGFKFSWLKNQEASNGKNRHSVKPSRSEQFDAAFDAAFPNEARAIEGDFERIGDYGAPE